MYVRSSWSATAAAAVASIVPTTTTTTTTTTTQVVMKPAFLFALARRIFLGLI